MIHLNQLRNNFKTMNKERDYEGHNRSHIVELTNYFTKAIFGDNLLLLH